MALQAGAIWILDAAPECNEGGAEVRWLGGHSYGDGAFLNVEAATRTLGGGCTGARIDVTGGARVGENWLAPGKLFVDSPHQGEETVKALTRLVRFAANGPRNSVRTARPH